MLAQRGSIITHAIKHTVMEMSLDAACRACVCVIPSAWVCVSEADKESVFLTTKVRTKLKGDGSWLQRRNEAQGETNEEKPW